MVPRSLTTAEANALVRRGLAVRLSPEYLTTRVALYERDRNFSAGSASSSGLRVGIHHRDGRGMLWKQPTRRFEPCTCAKCTR